jgi:F-type H+-transporting ATPase subunit b
MLEINPGLIIWTVVTFVCLAAVLAKFAWKPMLKALFDREEKIRSALEDADRARIEAAELIKQNEKNLARAEEEYQRIVREGKALAEKMKQEIVLKAKQQAQHEIKLAEEEIQRNVESAKQQLRADVADLAIKAAEKILEETLDEKRQKKIVDAFIDRLPKN